MWRAVMIAAMVGSTATHLVPELPTNPVPVAVSALLGTGLMMLRRRGTTPGLRGMRISAAILCAVLLGATYTAWLAQQRLADTLSVEHENLVTRLTIRIAGLATGDERLQTFEAEVLASPVAGVPGRLRVVWPAMESAPIPELIPGQVYQAALVLRRPHGSQNPHGFDAEAWLFERGIRARATVRGQPWPVTHAGVPPPRLWVQRVRHFLRASLREAVGERRYGPVIIALALGDQASVAATDWEVFSRTGIIHLVSISGLHVTLLAGMLGSAVFWLWKRGRWRGLPLAERLPAQVAAATAALITAWLYCLVAGWGVPAQRTFFMVATVGVAAILRLPMTASRILTVAAFVVLVLDPWSALSPGFWLSFAAVAALMLLASGRWSALAQGDWRSRLRASAELQGAMTLVLVPLLAVQFQEVSVASPLANALAIPVVSLIVTPLALLGMLLSPWPLVGVLGHWAAQLAEWIFRGMMWPVGALADQAWASWSVAAPTWPWLLLALFGVFYALLPKGAPARPLAWLLMAPLFVLSPPRPASGEWRLTVLDVGQGGAAVLETRHHVLVFDTGPPFGPHSDAGDRVVWPFLRGNGWRAIDALVISHGDADHIGGLPSLLRRLRVEVLRAPDPVSEPGRTSAGEPTPHTPCGYGQGWQWDGVSFRFLAPAEPSDTRALVSHDRNAASCVLQVQGWHHSALFTGDIGVAEERLLLQQSHQLSVASDVVLMAHHGSLTSSSEPFVRAAGAAHAVAQAGYLSRFGHPRPEVMARWQAAGAQTHNTATSGALRFASTAQGLRVQAYRDEVRRYWHTPLRCRGPESDVMAKPQSGLPHWLAAIPIVRFSHEDSVHVEPCF